MDMKQIEARIAKEQSEFNGQRYTGKVPANLLDLFKKAFMVVHPMSHKLTPTMIRNFMGKKVSELTVLEAGKILNLVISAEPEKIYKDFNAALKGYEDVSNAMIDYNLGIKAKEAEWNALKENLIKLSGIDVNARRSTLYQA